MKTRPGSSPSSSLKSKPEYLAPGVYVEETSQSSPPIAGVVAEFVEPKASVGGYVHYLEQSIASGTRWVAFEPNGEPLWAKLRLSISDFLMEEWRNGRLLGNTEREAFFVRCDRQTVTQQDVVDGRLFCEIGVALMRPAEFTIIRLSQKTAA